MASSHDCKYVEVSAGLNHNVDTLLVRSPQVNSYHLISTSLQTQSLMLETNEIHSENYKVDNKESEDEDQNVIIKRQGW